MSVLECEEAGLLIEEAACERYELEHVANNGSDPQFHDCIATDATGVSDVTAGDEIECKACSVSISDGNSSRRGRWWFSRDAHDQLLAADGQYVLGVYDAESAVIQRLAMVDVTTVDAVLDGRWTECGPRHPSAESAQLPWPAVFTSGLEVDVDGGASI